MEEQKVSLTTIFFRKLNYSNLSGTAGALVVDNSMIVLSRGRLEVLDTLGVSIAGRIITVNWNYDNYGDGTDKVTIVAYCPAFKQSYANTASIRSTGNAALSVPSIWATKQVFVYAFTGNAEISSATQYVGVVTV
ncbi:MAG: hypothetical protein IPG24_13360 [Leptospiraceae bacterium]|nr:hypothetical protein [Leptospiraceae bacterium]